MKFINLAVSILCILFLLTLIISKPMSTNQTQNQNNLSTKKKCSQPSLTGKSSTSENPDKEVLFLTTHNLHESDKQTQDQFSKILSEIKKKNNNRVFYLETGDNHIPNGGDWQTSLKNSRLL